MWASCTSPGTSAYTEPTPSSTTATTLAHCTGSFARTTISLSAGTPASQAAVGESHPRTSTHTTGPAAAYSPTMDNPRRVSPNPGGPTRPTTRPGINTSDSLRCNSPRSWLSRSCPLNVGSETGTDLGVTLFPKTVGDTTPVGTRSTRIVMWHAPSVVSSPTVPTAWHPRTLTVSNMCSMSSCITDAEEYSVRYHEQRTKGATT
jgi:hypothetical protein